MEVWGNIMKKISWEHWEEPENPAAALLEHEDESDEFDDELPHGQNMVEFPLIFQYNTPIGPYHNCDPMRPSAMFDCWVMHTNFDITPRIAKAIGIVPGVEVAKIITRYRCFIGVAPMFKFRDVANEIKEILCGGATIDTVRKQIEHFKHWAVYVDEEGGVKYIFTNMDDDVKYVEKLSVLKNGGHAQLITSENTA